MIVPSNVLVCRRRPILILIVGVAPATLITAQIFQRNPTDIDGNGLVYFNDFLILAQNFGKRGAPFDPATRNTVVHVFRDTIEIVRTDTVLSLIQDVDRPEESDWQTIFANERRNVYWLGVGVEEPGYPWRFVGTGFAVETWAICTNVHVVLRMQTHVASISSDLSPVFVAIPSDGTGREAYRLFAAGTGTIVFFWHPNYD